MAFVGQPTVPAGGAGAMYQYPGGPSHFVPQQPGAAALAPPAHAYAASSSYMQNMAPHPGGSARVVPPAAAAPAPAAKGKGGKSSSAQRSNAVPITIPPSLLPPVGALLFSSLISSTLPLLRPNTHLQGHQGQFLPQPVLQQQQQMVMGQHAKGVQQQVRRHRLFMLWMLRVVRALILIHCRA